MKGCTVRVPGWDEACKGRKLFLGGLFKGER